MFTRRFLPKEESYFRDFKEMITYTHEMGTLVSILFSSEIPDRTHVLKIKALEVSCDEVSSKVIKRLNKTFITPFDREDIFAMIKRLSNISDLLLNAANRVDSFNITRKISYAGELSKIILQQLVELDTAIQDLKEKKLSVISAVKTLESEADKVYQQAIKELFEKATDPFTLIKEKEVLEILEKASDKCQSLANIIQSIYIKNS